MSAITASSLKQSTGYTRNRTEQFRSLRQEYRERKTRFQKKNSSVSPTSSTTAQVLLTSRSTDVSIELGGISHTLPPAWVDEYEKAEEKIREIKDIYKQLQKDIAKRIKIQFGNYQDLDRDIERGNENATKLLQDCEFILHKIMQSGRVGDSKSEEKIRKNVERSLATQIQEVATLLRKQQKGLLDKIKDNNSTGSDSQLNVESSLNDEENFSQDLREMIAAEDLAKERDEDVNKLIDNINQLNHLFKQMNNIVLEQGTIVDRIDYNLEQATEKTHGAKKKLGEANKIMRSKCGDHFIKILAILDVIFLILFLLKYRVI